MNPEITHELKISFPNSIEGIQSKIAVIDWLHSNGIHSFVEGVIDDLDLDYEFGQPERDFYQENGGDRAPIILCSFDEDYIVDLQNRITEFDKSLSIERSKMETKVWQDGWKTSFKPIETKMFRIRPAWEERDALSQLIDICLDPGMAFGTGQHASTQLCLQLIEELYRGGFNFSEESILDLGTGSGILAVALSKLGSNNLLATDIDPDAIIAARQNAKLNDISFPVELGSLVQVPHRFGLIVANILFSVLSGMIEDLSSNLRPGGKLILSGLIEEHSEEMIDLARVSGLKCLTVLRSEGWVGLLFEKL